MPPEPPFPAGSESSSADPTLVQDLAGLYCKKWPVTSDTTTYPIAPDNDLSATLTAVDLSPPAAGAKSKAKKNSEDCYMGCHDLFTQLTSSCHFDPHTIFEGNRQLVRVAAILQ